MVRCHMSPWDSSTYLIIQETKGHTSNIREGGRNGKGPTLLQIRTEAHRGLFLEDSGLIRGPSPLPSYFEGAGKYQHSTTLLATIIQASTVPGIMQGSIMWFLKQSA